jgi:hypothetical protein
LRRVHGRSQGFRMEAERMKSNAFRFSVGWWLRLNEGLMEV